MPLIFPTLRYLLVLWLLYHHSLAAKVSCNRDNYGTPRASDCDELLRIFANPTDDQPRLFDDEQLRTPGGLNFPGVKNVFPDQVVQVPAYWSLSQYTHNLSLSSQTSYVFLTDRCQTGTCNMAIMSYAESPIMRVPLGVSSWKRVHTRVDDMINRCLFMGQAEGGNVIIESCMCPKHAVQYIGAEIILSLQTIHLIQPLASSCGNLAPSLTLFATKYKTIQLPSRHPYPYGI